MVNHIYITQVSLSLIMVTFCIAMISINNTAESRSVYLPILTSIIGVWLPQPQSSSGNPGIMALTAPLLPTT